MLGFPSGEVQQALEGEPVSAYQPEVALTTNALPANVVYELLCMPVVTQKNIKTFRFNEKKYEKQTSRETQHGTVTTYYRCHVKSNHGSKPESSVVHRGL
jgi:hypothetical protein